MYCIILSVLVSRYIVPACLVLVIQNKLEKLSSDLLVLFLHSYLCLACQKYCPS